MSPSIDKDELSKQIRNITLKGLEQIRPVCKVENGTGIMGVGSAVDLICIDIEALITTQINTLLDRVRDELPNSHNGKGRVFTASFHGSAMAQGYNQALKDCQQAIDQLRQELTKEMK